MALDPKIFKNEIYMPVSSESGSFDSEWDSLNNDHAEFMLRNMDKTLFDDLGIDTSEHHAEKDSKGNLRLYQMDADGRISDPFAGGDQPNSNSFLEKITRGNIFAYPAGQKEPVQLQIDYDKKPPVLTYSKPMTENLFPKPRPLSFWTRVRAFFGGAKEEVREYNESMKRYEASNSVREATGAGRTEELLEQENKDLEEKTAQRKEEEVRAQRREQQERLKSDAVHYKSRVDRSMDLM